MKLKYQFINLIIIILTFSAFVVGTMGYALFIQGYVKSAVSVEAKNVLESNYDLFNQKISKISIDLDAQKDGEYKKVNIEESVIDEYFKDSNYAIIENSVVSSDGTGYSIYVSSKDKKSFGIMDNKYFFSNLKNDFSVIMFSRDGMINYTTKPLVENQFYDLLRKRQQINTNDILDGLDNGKILFKTYDIDNGENFFSLQKFGNQYMAILVPTSSADLLTPALTAFTYLYLILLIIIIIVSVWFISRRAKHRIEISYLSDGIYAKRINAMIFRISRKGVIKKANSKFYTMTGLYNRAKNLDLSIFEPIGDKPILKHFSKGEQCIVKVTNKKTNEDLYIRLAPVRNHNEYVVQGQDVTKEYLLNEYMQSISSINQVTSLPNKIRFMVNYPDFIEELSVSIVSINIMNFRRTNKIFGRQAGDNVLQAFSKILTSKFEGCKVYHFDGDFFVVVVESEDKLKVVECAKKVSEELKKPLYFENNHTFIEMKMGIYYLESADKDRYEDVLKKSNTALTQAMATYNRDYYIYDNNLAAKASKEIEMQKDLMQAIENKDFVMYYQPQFNIDENRICGFEALIRWPNEKYAKLSPQVFIELAEKNGMINKIGKIVMELVFSAAKEFQKYGVELSMNVSPIQILQAGFVSDLLESYSAHKLNPGSVCIEITETFLMENFSLVVEKLRILESHGFSIHLDDFGTGYSSMLYLMDLPADTIKIDKEFTKVVDVDKASQTIVKRLVAMATDLNKSVIVEGVETIEQLKTIKKMRCNIIQGYLFGKPVTYEEAIEEIINPSITLDKRTKIIKTE